MSDIDTAVVQLAIGAAGEMRDRRAWELKVAEITPIIAAMLRPVDGDDATTPAVTARKVREASVFQGEFVKYSDDEMSKTHRLMVAFTSKTTDSKDQDGDGLEWMRTEPSWTRAGYVLQRVVRDLEPGTQCIIYKSVEPIPGNKKVRVLVHLESRGKPRSAGDPQSPQTGRVPAERQAGDGDAAPPSTSSSPAPSGPITERFSKLDVRKQIAFGRAARAVTESFMDPPPEHLDRVLVILDKIERGEPVT